MHRHEGNTSARNTLLGGIFGGGLALAVFGLWYFAAVSLDLPEPQPPAGEAPAPAQSSDELNLYFVIVPTAIGALCGAALGWFAGSFVRFRYLKLLGVAALLYLLAAWIIGVTLALGIGVGPDPEKISIDAPFLLATIQNGVLGALVMSPFFLPLIFALSVVLERMTRPARSI